MSKLSELLNPAPSSQATPEAPQTSQSHQIQPLVLDGTDHRTSSFSHGNSSQTRYPSLTSPGLEALANAASNTAPILSPPQTTSTFTQPQSAPYQQSSYAQFGSRPGSSHTLPPLSDGLSSGQPHSAGLEQYHHLSGGERRLDSLADHSTTLPPLQHSPDGHTSHITDAFQQVSDASKQANGGLSDDMQGISAQFPPLTSVSMAEQTKTAPVPSKIRQPSPGPQQPLSAIDIPNAQNEQVEVKAELVDNPLDTSHIEASQNEGSEIISAQPAKALESQTPKSFTEIKSDTNHTPSPMTVDNSMAASSLKPQVPKSKKRAAPSSSKKGTASTVKRAAKKPKIDNESIDGTPSGQRTGTPATSRTSMTPAPKQRKQGSVTPARSSSVANGAEESDDDDGEVYCICRKPDDHTIMIGCDGPCEDWYHMRCVDMDTAKSKLIHKWYCPLCAEKGHETLWKRMCRLEGCQEPARQEGENKSKYCSDEHGAEFMRSRIASGELEQKKVDAPRSHKKRRQDNYTDTAGNAEDNFEDAELPTRLRGGVLGVGELKAVIDGSRNLEDFRRLGEGVLSPPPTISPEGEDPKKEKMLYTDEEKAQLEEISDKREKCRARKKMLDDRDKLLLLITARAKAVLAELKEKDKSFKDICGYDARLSWSDQEFNEWRASAEGRKALEKGGALGPPTIVGNTKDVNMVNGESTAGTSGSNEQSGGNEEEGEEIGKGICKKKRCERHRQWPKLQQQDNMFEKDLARQEMKRLEAEEKGLINRATIRGLEMRDAGEG